MTRCVRKYTTNKFTNNTKVSNFNGTGLSQKLDLFDWKK